MRSPGPCGPEIELGTWPRVALARAAWLLTISAIGAASAWAISRTYPVHGQVGAPVALVLLTYGTASIVGKAAPLLGAAVIVAIVANLRAYSDISAETWQASGATQVGLYVGARLAGLAFVVRGSRPDPSFG